MVTIQKIMALGLIAAASSFMQPQAYQPILASDTTQWNSTYVSGDIILTAGIKISGDTIINNHEYRFATRECLNVDWGCYFQEGRFGYVREDTAAGKAWVLPKDSSEERLFYDISLSVGDTMAAYCEGASCPIVYTVSQYDGRKHVQFVTAPEKFVEGIGSLDCRYFFSDMFYAVYSVLICAFQNGVRTFHNNELYFFPSVDSCVVLGGGAVERSETRDRRSGLLISPNPFNPVVTIQVGMHRVTSLRIFNIDGQFVADLTKQIVNGSVVWNAAGYPSGTYLVCVSGGEKTYSKVLILMK